MRKGSRCLRPVAPERPCCAARSGTIDYVQEMASLLKPPLRLMVPTNPGTGVGCVADIRVQFDPFFESDANAIQPSAL